MLHLLVKGDGHDSIREIEGLLDAIPMVDVNVDVQHSRMHLEQLQDANDNVIDVAEAGGLKLLGVVQSPTPVDGNVALVVVQFGGPLHGSPGVAGAEVVEAIEHGAVIAHVEVGQALGEALDVLRRDPLQELNVLF